MFEMWLKALWERDSPTRAELHMANSVTKTRATS
jgi:hypothetical protein